MVLAQETRKVGEQITLGSLKTRLDSSRIDYSGWGEIPGSKPIERLLKDINGGECRLVEDKNGRLIREIEQVGVFVFARDTSGKLFILKEDHQVFNDGRTRSRKLEGVSFREKLDIINEGFNAAVYRGLKEELPEIYDVESKKNPVATTDPLLRVDSYRPPQILVETGDYVPSFPGLPNRSMEYRYAMMISPQAYKPEGYVTKEKDKTTYFVWERIAPDHPYLPATSWQKLKPAQAANIIDKTRLEVPDVMGLQLEVIAEYLFLSNRIKTLGKKKNLEYGSTFELESAATAFRLIDLERIYPNLKSLKIRQ